MRFLFVFLLFCSACYAQQSKMEIIQNTETSQYGLQINDKNVIPEKYDSLVIKGNFIAGLIHKSWNVFDLHGKLIKSGVKSHYLYSSNAMQILDAFSKVYFIDSHGQAIKPKKRIHLPLPPNDELGNSTYVSYTIIGKKIIQNDHKVFTPDSLYSLYFKQRPPERASFYKLINNKKKIEFERGWYTGDIWGHLDPDFVIVKGNHQYGLWSLLEQVYILPLEFDKIRNFTSYLYLKKGNLATFYPNIGKVPKYKKLTQYQEFFARFETPDGKKGWVDRKGKEYFDQ